GVHQCVVSFDGGAYGCHSIARLLRLLRLPASPEAALWFAVVRTRFRFVLLCSRSNRRSGFSVPALTPSRAPCDAPPTEHNLAKLTSRGGQCLPEHVAPKAPLSAAPRELNARQNAHAIVVP